MTKKALKLLKAQEKNLLYAGARAIVKAGKCPACGAKLRRNNSHRGWWQCSQLGGVDFRKDAEKPSCDWQIFTA